MRRSPHKLRASLAKVKTDIRRARAALMPLLQSRGITSAAWKLI